MSDWESKIHYTINNRIGTRSTCPPNPGTEVRDRRQREGTIKSELSALRVSCSSVYKITSDL